VRDWRNRFLCRAGSSDLLSPSRLMFSSATNLLHGPPRHLLFDGQGEFILMARRAPSSGYLPIVRPGSGPAARGSTSEPKAQRQTQGQQELPGLSGPEISNDHERQQNTQSNEPM